MSKTVQRNYSRDLSISLKQASNELLSTSLKILILKTLLSVIDVGSDFLQGILLCQDPNLKIYGIITILINWIPGIVAAVHLYTYQRYDLGPTKTLFGCCKYPLFKN